MEPVLKEQIDSIYTKKDEMITELHQFCEINSGSENLSGLAQMLTALEKAFSPIADKIQIKQLPPFETINMAGEKTLQSVGDALFIQKRPHLKRRILLSGHMDTVYAADHPFQHLKYLNDEEINGPGVSDMKGGLLVILHALTAFETMPQAADLGWDVLISADEEIGSPASAQLFKEIAADYQAALVYEPATSKSGSLAKNRKGSGKISLIAQGKAAHAGRAFNEGRNAIAYLSEILVAVHALNGLRDGVTINIGKIAGGEALNIVPEKAVAKLDIRITQPEDEDWVWQQLHAIQSKLMRKDYTLSIEGAFSRPVKRISQATERLFDRIHYQGLQLGLNIDWKDTGGCCDGNNLAAHGLPVLDTLGVRGGHIHSPDEFIVIDSLPERAALSFLVLQDLAAGGLEDLYQ